MNAVAQWLMAYVLNSAWQVLVLALCTWALVRMTARGGARLHYWLWVGCLLLGVLLPMAPASGLRMPSWNWSWHKDTAAPAAEKSAAPAVTKESTVDRIAVYTDEVVAPARTGWVGRAILWVYGISLFLGVVKLLRELAATRAVVRRSQAFALPEWMAEELARSASVLGAGAVEVRSSAEIRSPATVSWPQAMLLVPEDFAACAEADASAAIGHELAHVRRGDFWVNVLCEVASVAAFWHPAMHWVKRRVAEAREVCCDELAAEATRGRAAYARSLVSLAEGVVSKSTGDLSLGMAKENDLKQ